MLYILSRPEKYKSEQFWRYTCVRYNSQLVWEGKDSMLSVPPAAESARGRVVKTKKKILREQHIRSKNIDAFPGLVVLFPGGSALVAAPRLPEGGGNGLGAHDDHSREVDDEGGEALLAHLEEAFSSERGDHQDRAKILETIEVCFRPGMDVFRAYGQKVSWQNEATSQ